MRCAVRAPSRQTRIWTMGSGGEYIVIRVSKVLCSGVCRSLDPDQVRRAQRWWCEMHAWPIKVVWYLTLTVSPKLRISTSPSRSLRPGLRPLANKVIITLFLSVACLSTSVASSYKPSTVHPSTGQNTTVGVSSQPCPSPSSTSAQPFQPTNSFSSYYDRARIGLF